MGQAEPADLSERAEEPAEDEHGRVEEEDDAQVGLAQRGPYGQGMREGAGPARRPCHEQSLQGGDGDEQEEALVATVRMAEDHGRGQRPGEPEGGQERQPEGEEAGHDNESLPRGTLPPPRRTGMGREAALSL
jgi:hypothetical protein